MATKILKKAGKQNERGQLQPLAQSAFRTLGLAASASQKEIYEKASALRLARQLGVEKKFDEDLAWLAAMSRTEADVRDALGRLASPPQRLLERLFWFYERPDVERPTRVAGLRAATDRLLDAAGPSARHDAALFSLAALHRLDPDFKQQEEWARAYALWREVVEREEFWSLLVVADLKGEFELLATFGEVKELRGRVPRLLTTTVAERARDAAARDDFVACDRALMLLRGAALPRALLDEYMDATLGPVEDRIERLTDEAFGWVGLYYGGEEANSQRKYRFDQAWKNFHWKVKPHLRRFFYLAGGDNHGVRRSCEHAAHRLGELAAAYSRYGFAKESLHVFRQARTLAPPGSASASFAGERLRSFYPTLDLSERSDAEYVASLEGELGDMRTPSKLFEEKEPVATAQKGNDETLGGCLAQVALYALMIMSCLALDKCGITNTKKSGGRYTPSTMNFNYTPPRIVIPPMPSLESLNITPLSPPAPPGKTRRKAPRPAGARQRALPGGNTDANTAPPVSPIVPVNANTVGARPSPPPKK
ncbi:MAG: hypothetical protein LC802_01080 [Acidobacteria bacterium]|nr:hypothetical protein [Acidobacteriota bacterium]